MAEFFVSYTTEDKPWADWIGQELEKLGHKARLFDWEVGAGGDVAEWMIDRHDEADHVLCVFSSRYFDKTRPYSKWERNTAAMAAVDERPNFLLPVFIESHEAPTLFKQFKRCDLHGVSEDAARVRLADYLKPQHRLRGLCLFLGPANLSQVTSLRRKRLRWHSPAPRAQLPTFPSTCPDISWGAKAI